MATVTCTVALDNSNPPVPKMAFDPAVLDIDHSGIEVIHWKAAKGSTNFTFVALVISKPNPFCGTWVDTARNEIITHTNNQGDGPYDYIVLFEYSNAIYRSILSWVQNGGGGTIRNN